MLIFRGGDPVSTSTCAPGADAARGRSPRPAGASDFAGRGSGAPCDGRTPCRRAARTSAIRWSRVAREAAQRDSRRHLIARGRSRAAGRLVRCATSRSPCTRMDSRSSRRSSHRTSRRTRRSSARHPMRWPRIAATAVIARTCDELYDRRARRAAATRLPVRGRPRTPRVERQAAVRELVLARRDRQNVVVGAARCAPAAWPSGSNGSGERSIILGVVSATGAPAALRRWKNCSGSRSTCGLVVRARVRRWLRARLGGRGRRVGRAGPVPFAAVDLDDEALLRATTGRGCSCVPGYGALTRGARSRP